MALNSRILAAKSQFFGVMGISNADKEFVVKCDPLVRTFPSFCNRVYIQTFTLQLVYKLYCQNRAIVYKLYCHYT